MKVYVIKKNYEWFKEMASEGRTRSLEVSSYRLYEDDREIQIELGGEE